VKAVHRAGARSRALALVTLDLIGRWTPTDRATTR